MAGASCSLKCTRGNWSNEDLERSILAFRIGDMGLNKCALAYGIPKATLKRHLNGQNKIAKGHKKLGRGTILNLDLEQQVHDLILRLEGMFFGLTRKDLMALAFEIAEENGIEHSFNKEKKSAGKGWYYNFLKRFPDISLRQPEATSISRASGFNRDAISRYFSLLEGIIQDNDLIAERIFNVDESGISTVQKRCQKVLGQKGKKLVNGTGTQYVPPMIIFKRKRLPPEFSDGAPSGSLVTCTENGWIDTDAFCRWMSHFIDHVKPTFEHKILLILDGHKTHTKNLQAIKLAHDNNIILLSLPPHTTHKTQPLDRSLFKPLQTFYDQAVEKWLRTNPGRSVSPYQVSCLFGEAYMKAATMSGAVHGFASCGIWPCNRNVFAEHEFAPSFAPYSSQSPSTQVSLQSSVPPTSTTSNLSWPLTQNPPALLVNCPSALSTQTTITPPINDLINCPTSSTTQITTTPPINHPPALLDNCPTASSTQILSNSPINCPSALSRHTPSRTIHCVEQSFAASASIVQTSPDGRCFFRAVATSMDESLQSAVRVNGEIVCPMLRLRETARADEIRNAMVVHILSNKDNFTDSMRGDAVNADMPAHIRFDTLQDRVIAMASLTSYVGEFEIQQTAEVIRKKIEISSGDSILCYGEDTDGKPVHLFYTAFGDNTGHYDCRIEGLPISSPGVLSPSIQRRIPVLPNIQRKIRSKKERSEILTSSPYKKTLQERETSCASKMKKKGAGVRMQTGAKKNQNIKKKRIDKIAAIVPQSRKADVNAWYCFMCDECRFENMIQCTKCHRWAHEECAGMNDDGFVCELCL